QAVHQDEGIGLAAQPVERLADRIGGDDLGVELAECAGDAAVVGHALADAQHALAGHGDLLSRGGKRSTPARYAPGCSTKSWLRLTAARQLRLPQPPLV